MTKRRNESLDLLRAIAISMVVAVHTAQAPEAILKGTKVFASSYGGMGVQLFFIVSAFTMMLTFGSSADLRHTLAFYVRRIFRIAPMFWTAAIVYGAWHGFSPRYWAPEGIGWADVWLTVSFLHWLSPNAFNSVVPGGWSIAIEVLFYALFPIFLYLFRSGKQSFVYAAILVIHLVGPIAVRAIFHEHLSKTIAPEHMYQVNAFFQASLPNQIICFGFGFVLYQLLMEKKLPLAGWLFVAVTTLYSPFGLQVFCLFLFSFFVMSVGLRSNLCSLAGGLSYSVYLIHFGMISGAEHIQKSMNWYLPFELLFIVIMALSLAVAKFITKPLIEDPFIGIGRIVARRVKSGQTQTAMA